MKKFFKILGYPIFAKDFIIGLFPFSKNMSASAVYGFSTLFRFVIGFLGELLCTMSVMVPSISFLAIFSLYFIFMFAKAVFYDVGRWIRALHGDTINRINTNAEYSKVKKRMKEILSLL